jgi:hypothetical protein
MDIFEKKKYIIEKYNQENKSLDLLRKEYHIYNPINDGSCCYRAIIQGIFNIHFQNSNYFNEENELIQCFNYYINSNNYIFSSGENVDGFCYLININDENELVLILHEMMIKYVKENKYEQIIELGYDSLEKFILDVHSHLSLEEYYESYRKTYIDNFYTCNHWGGTPEIYIISKIFNINIFTYLLQIDYEGFLLSTTYDEKNDLSIIKLNLSEVFMERSLLEESNELDRPILRLCLENYDNSNAHYLSLICYNIFY